MIVEDSNCYSARISPGSRILPPVAFSGFPTRQDPGISDVARSVEGWKRGGGKVGEGR